ncbi:hypothetical protein CORC01_06619 [Colletotrichum orchidophilum]|uniref:Uncharacterized protein n=1 Tax=Colletotrichum orchidophilum TaxID=1209926 RepID=A0A1G4B9V6_9PEZI|nr:uncharacterized protein CORC01_06619 [Colletotrichum orchidophilum]OHE98105.1 hypothetical protein CORC01_06619 [Colletotrichum orchidophilum]
MSSARGFNINNISRERIRRHLAKRQAQEPDEGGSSTNDGASARQLLPTASSSDGIIASGSGNTAQPLVKLPTPPMGTVNYPVLPRQTLTNFRGNVQINNHTSNTSNNNLYFGSGSQATIREGTTQMSQGAKVVRLTTTWSRCLQVLEPPEEKTQVWHWAWYWGWSGLTKAFSLMWTVWIIFLAPAANVVAGCLWQPVQSAVTMALGLAVVMSLVYFAWQWFSLGAMIGFATQSFTTVSCLYTGAGACTGGWVQQHSSSPLGTGSNSFGGGVGVGGGDDDVILAQLEDTMHKHKPVFQQTDVSRAVLWDIVVTHAWLEERFGMSSRVCLVSSTTDVNHTGLVKPSAESAESVFHSFAALESAVDEQWPRAVSSLLHSAVANSRWIRDNPTRVFVKKSWLARTWWRWFQWGNEGDAIQHSPAAYREANRRIQEAVDTVAQALQDVATVVLSMDRGGQEETNTSISYAQLVRKTCGWSSELRHWKQEFPEYALLIGGKPTDTGEGGGEQPECNESNKAMIPHASKVNSMLQSSANEADFLCHRVKHITQGRVDQRRNGLRQYTDELKRLMDHTTRAKKLADSVEESADIIADQIDNKLLSLYKRLPELVHATFNIEDTTSSGGRGGRH